MPIMKESRSAVRVRIVPAAFVTTVGRARGRAATPEDLVQAVPDNVPAVLGNAQVVRAMIVPVAHVPEDPDPAVTVALAARRGFPWGKVPLFAVAQTAGAFAAAAVVFVTYREAFTAFDGGVRQVQGQFGTAGIFATYPQPFLSLGGGLVDQVVGTALLLVGVLAITDSRNLTPPGWLAAPLIGLLVVAIGVAFGFNAGYAINPARDLGPRLAHSILPIPGKGSSDWGYAWVPVIGPIVGGVAGALIYRMLWGA